MMSIANNSDEDVIADFSSPSGEWLEIVGASHRNLRNVNVSIPLGALVAIGGPSGSGKSTLVQEILYNTLARRLHRASTIPGAHDALRGMENINKVIRVDQQPIGNSPSSNPATYTGVFDLIRDLFAQLPDAKVRGYTARRFSFNVEGGRCEDCQGMGQKCIEMHFLPDVWVTCETCNGLRYNEETLAVKFHGKSISEVLEMSCGQAVQLFENIPKIRRTLQTLCDVGLDYVTLGQSAPTLSGGEAQRVKLASELARPDTGRTLYLLDEPSTGLHFEDLKKLLDVFHRLVDLGNTVIVIEHNLDILKQADWVIEMGPEAGQAGGQVVTVGTPEDIVEYAKSFQKLAKKQKSEESTLTDERGMTWLRSHTGEALGPVLEAAPREERPLYDPHEADQQREGDLDIDDVGAQIQMPWEIDGRRWHTKDRVGRDGQPCNWEGKVLAEVVDRIQASESFSDANWNSRTIVEIAAKKKSDGWFFHGITGESWLVKLKFRVMKGTFNKYELPQELNLPTLNQMDDLPIYSNDPRVKVKNLRGPFQEIEIRAHSWQEINKPEFWKFVDDAIIGFQRYESTISQDVESHMPWKKLGEKWHLSRKGFPPGKKVAWDQSVLEDVIEMLREVAPQGEILWNNQMLINMMIPGKRTAWAVVTTKKPEHVRLELKTNKASTTQGRIAGLGHEPDVDQSRGGEEIVRLHFRHEADLQKGDLKAFLKEHFSGETSSGQRSLL